MRRELWRLDAGAHLGQDTYEFTFEVDGSGLPDGRSLLTAAMDLERNNRDPCRFGDRSEAYEANSLGWLDIESF